MATAATFEKVPRTTHFLCYGLSEYCNFSYIAVNRRNEVLVVNSKNANVHVYNFKGTLLRIMDNQWSDGDDKVTPHAAALSRSNYFLVVIERTTTKRRILLYSDFGLKQYLYHEQIFPLTPIVTVDSNDKLLVLDNLRQAGPRVKVFDVKRGVRLIRFIYLDVCWDHPSSMAVGKDDKIYIANQENHCVRVYAANGNQIMVVGNEHSIKRPKKVLVSDEGSIVVVCEDNLLNTTQVTVFDSEGRLKAAYELNESCKDYALTADRRLVVLGLENFFAVYSLECFKPQGS